VVTKRHRGKGEGSIYKRKDGRWCAAYAPALYERRVLYGKTRAEVQEKLTAALHTRNQGGRLPRGQKTVALFIVPWLEGMATQLRPRTHEAYASIIRLHILPHIGKRPLRKLQPEDLDHLYSRELASGLSAGTVGNIHRILHRALADALRRGEVVRNVCDLVSPPKQQEKEMHALSPAQCQQLLAAAEGEEYEALYALALTTGMRQGELLGLRWADIDLDVGHIHVMRTIARVTGKGFIEQAPKTRAGRRGVVLTTIAIDALRHHRRSQREARLRAGPAWEDRDLVFCNTVGKPIEPGNIARRYFQPLLARAGLPQIRFHDLRHSAASLLLSLGTHPKIVQELLGHSKIGVTMDTYSHVLPSMQGAAMEELNHFLGRPPAR